MKKTIVTIFFLMFCIICSNVYSHSSVNISNNSNYKKYLKNHKNKKTPYFIVVKIRNQKLTLFKNGKEIKNFSVSTSKYGIGQTFDSFKTPLGLHKIEKKIGYNVPKYGIFKAKKYTGKTWSSKFSLRYFRKKRRKNHPDLIITRILTLTGLEQGINRGYNKNYVNVDSKERNIYIHGTTHESKIGRPNSIGCIYMKPTDIQKLFNIVPANTLVLIVR